MYFDCKTPPTSTQDIIDPPEHIEDTGKIVRVPEHIYYIVLRNEKSISQRKNVMINSNCILVCWQSAISQTNLF